MLKFPSPSSPPNTTTSSALSEQLRNTKSRAPKPNRLPQRNAPNALSCTPDATVTSSSGDYISPISSHRAPSLQAENPLHQKRLTHPVVVSPLLSTLHRRKIRERHQKLPRNIQSTKMEYMDLIQKQLIFLHFCCQKQEIRSIASSKEFR